MVLPLRRWAAVRRPSWASGSSPTSTATRSSTATADAPTPSAGASPRSSRKKDGDKVTGEAEISLQYSATGANCSYQGPDPGRYQCDLEAELGSDKVGEIEIEEVDTTLECTLEDDTLDCEDDTGLDLTFERA